MRQKPAPYISSDAEASASSALNELSAAWRGWRRVVGKQDSVGWRPSEETRQRLYLRLKRFAQRRSESADEIVASISELARAKYLMQAALAWQSPMVGAGRTSLDAIRGEQWRLVVAWGGMEVMIKSLIPTKGHGVDSKTISSFVEQVGLTDVLELEAPQRDLKQLRLWLDADEHFGQEAILVHLGNKKAAKNQADILREWLIQGKPVSCWSDALRLAQALRHKTAHGSLSASKVKDWGLRPAFKRLVGDLSRIVTVAFQRLADDKP